ncbi:MAG: HpcH/HpaI aldolase family protein [Planctomycetota bacterium]|jgi:4-hydroxy-2-oxoheptanedioate aldolase
MQKSIVRQKLANNEPVFCTKINYKDPDLFEIVGQLGFDCVWICNEHIAFDQSMLTNMVRACRVTGMDAMIRTKPGDYRDIIHPLEYGAKGIMLPRTKDAAEVRQVVSDMKFAPQGKRGMDGVNADSGFGQLGMEEYMKFANDNTFLMAQIEDRETVDHIEEIADVEGVDVVFIGPADLSINLGVPGQFDHPEMQKVIDRVLKACEKSGKAAGIPCGDPAKFKDYLDRGFKFITSGSDFRAVTAFFHKLREDALKAGFKLRDVRSPNGISGY